MIYYVESCSDARLSVGFSQASFDWRGIRPECQGEIANDRMPLNVVFGGWGFGDKVLGLEVSFYSVLGVGISAVAFWFFPEIEWLFRWEMDEGGAVIANHKGIAH